MSIRSLCNVDVELFNTTSDVGLHGERIYTHASVGNITATIQPRSARTMNKAGREAESVTHWLYSESPAVLDLVLGDSVVADDVTYQVCWSGDEAGRGRVYSVALKRIR